MASFSPIPPSQCCFAGSKKYRKKSRHHCSNIERGSGGGLSSEGGQRLLAETVFLIYARNFDGPFSSLSRDRFSKKHNIKQPNVNKPELPLKIISKEMGRNNVVPKFGKAFCLAFCTCIRSRM